MTSWRPRIEAWQARIDAWWTRPQADAAGSLGLYRIVFAFGFLWKVSLFDTGLLAGMPPPGEMPLVLLDLLPRDPSVLLLRGLEMTLVAALVLLIAGVHVPAATSVVFVTGLARESYANIIDVENDGTIAVFLVPLLALLTRTWGDTYALDARRARSHDLAPVDPADTHWRYALMPRALLVMLAVLFPLGALFKVQGDGMWFEHDNLVAMLTLHRNVDAAIAGTWMNPLAPWLVAYPGVGAAVQWAVLLFEATFFLVLAGPRIRRVYLALAMLFHGLNALLLHVSFTAILAGYALFVNWQAGWSWCRALVPALPGWSRLSSWSRERDGAVRVAVYAAALLLAVTWHAGARHLFNLGGLLDWKTPWFVITPLALAWLPVLLWSLIAASRTAVRDRYRARSFPRLPRAR